MLARVKDPLRTALGTLAAALARGGGPMGLQVWVSTGSGRVPTPEEAVGLLDRSGVVCRVGDLMPEDRTVTVEA